MSRQGHARFFAMATIAWSAFWVLGLPSYYQQYSPRFMVWFDTVLLAVIVPVLFLVLRQVPSGRRRIAASWIAFYFTVPLLVYDWLYCGIYLGHGAAFLWRYWYVTVYYVIPWIVAPGVAALAPSASAEHSGPTRATAGSESLRREAAPPSTNSSNR